MAEKTEKATPKKLRDARKKGQVAKSQDFPSAFTFIVSIATTIIASGYLYEMLASYIISMFKLSRHQHRYAKSRRRAFFSSDPGHFQYEHADHGAHSLCWAVDQFSHRRPSVFVGSDEAGHQTFQSGHEH